MGEDCKKGRAGVERGDGKGRGGVEGREEMGRGEKRKKEAGKEKRGRKGQEEQIKIYDYIPENWEGERCKSWRTVTTFYENRL